MNWNWSGCSRESKPRLLAMAAVCGLGPQPVMSQPVTWGLTSVGVNCAPAPPGAQPIPIPNAGFELAVEGRPQGGWSLVGGRLADDGAAPQGCRHVLLPARRGVRLVSPKMPVTALRPVIVCFQLRSTATATARLATDSAARDRHLNCIGSATRPLPNTGGEWRPIALFWRISPAATSLRVFIQPEPSPDGVVEVDDFAVRTATEKELSRAYAGWRAEFPRYDLSPRPSDGCNLALSVRKLEGRGVPGKPFVIWAVGSSYTNFLGDGETLIQELRRRFPSAPPIIYKKHCGASVPWQYVAGWVHQFVIPQQPDLVLCYTIGKPNDLERMIADIRSRTTADIIVPSIHWRMRDADHWGVDENAADQDVGAVREVCRRHGVEFVENRREWAEFMRRHGLKVEIDPAGMLRDAVHQSPWGALLINENIARHFARCEDTSYRPEEREHRLSAAAPRFARHRGPEDRLTADASWSVDDDGRYHTSAADARLRVDFTGNGLELVGVHSSEGGSIRVFIDGRPADEAAAFRTNHIVFAKQSRAKKRQFRGLLGDRAPHGILLGDNVVPQSWTIRMTSDDGDFELIGSVTGRDGAGNSRRPCTSRSGQIRFDPTWWRRPEFNLAGDEYQFDVERSVVSRLRFAGDAGRLFHVSLVQNLPVGRHTVDLVTDGKGSVVIDSVWVMSPPGAD